MMQLLVGTNIDFISKKRRRMAFAFSLTLILIGVIAFIINGFNLGIDFAGGSILQYKFDKPVNINEIRDELKKEGLGDSIIQTFGANDEILIKTRSGKDVSKLKKEFSEKYGSHAVLRREESVGPSVGKDLKKQAFWSIFWSLIGILLYVGWRFEFKYSVGAIVALIHDVTITLGLFALFGFEINIPVLAAILTLIGYSLNDTIVVYDRIREDIKRERPRSTEHYEKVINSAINSTLSRTIITSLTTLFVVVILLIFGGEVIRNFAFALTVGVIVGTYSSIFIASPILIEAHLRVNK